jgi:hypothetical protein
MSSISAIKIVAKVGPTPLICWSTRYPVPGEAVGNHRPEQLDFAVIDIDELQNRVHPLPVDQLQRRGAQPGHTVVPEQIRTPRQQTLFGQHPMNLRFEPGAQRNQLAR